MVARSRRTKAGAALALAALAGIGAAALVYLPLGIGWREAVVLAGAVYVVLVVETVLDEATFGGQDS